jgi:hypothetical protein
VAIRSPRTTSLDRITIMRNVLVERIVFAGNAVIVQGDQKVSMHPMITIQKVTSNVQSVSCQSPDVY